MRNHKEELEKIEKEINDRKIQKAKLEEKKKQCLEQEKEYKDKLKELGISEDNLDKEIQQLEKEIEQKLDECNKVIEGKEISHEPEASEEDFEIE